MQNIFQFRAFTASLSVLQYQCVRAFDVCYRAGPDLKSRSKTGYSRFEKTTRMVLTKTANIGSLALGKPDKNDGMLSNTDRSRSRAT